MRRRRFQQLPFDVLRRVSMDRRVKPGGEEIEALTNE
jgi:hypothetical protein